MELPYGPAISAEARIRFSERLNGVLVSKMGLFSLTQLPPLSFSGPNGVEICSLPLCVEMRRCQLSVWCGLYKVGSCHPPSKAQVVKVS